MDNKAKRDESTSSRFFVSKKIPTFAVMSSYTTPWDIRTLSVQARLCAVKFYDLSLVL